MVRLKEFVQGGADSRKEIHASLSLEDIQNRHRRMMKTIEASSAAERGEMGRSRALLEPGIQSNPPALAFDDAAEEVNDQPAIDNLGQAIMEEGVLDIDGD
jgi:hypothetical protein